MAGTYTGLAMDEVEKTVHSGLEAGIKEPRKIPQEPPTENTITLENITKVVGTQHKINQDTGEEEEKVLKRTLSPSKAATALLDHMTLLMSKANINISDPNPTRTKPPIWRYEDGTWKPDGERVIAKELYVVAEDLAYEKGVNEVYNNVRARANVATDMFNCHPYLFPCKDGVIDFQTGEFRASSPDDLFTFKYNVEYNCPCYDWKPFLWFLCSCLPDKRDVYTILELITVVGIRVSFEIFVLLFGAGNNGKGLLEKFIICLFTLARSTTIKLDEMKKSRFGEGEMLDKDVWIVTEVDSAQDATSALKKMASGESIDSDTKYGGRNKGSPTLVPILDANLPFSFKDDSKGRKRRFIKIDYPITFGDGENERPIDRHLLEKITKPEVMSGVVHIMAAMAPYLIESKKIYTRKSSQEQEEEYQVQQFSLNYFCNECLTQDWIDDSKPERLEVGKAYDEYIGSCTYLIEQAL
ncbi:MAG: DUF5906 domain-containing protein [Methanotrichaceae archaeon]|jgi:phage/plasmid-associated DNA primase